MVQTGGRDVLGDAHFQKEAQFLAIFRKITDAGRDGIARRADSRGLALYAHLAGLPGFGSENGSCKFGSSGAGQTGKSENLTGPGGEGDGPGLWAGESDYFERGHVLHERRRMAGFADQIAAHHERNQLLGRGLGDREGTLQVPVLQDGYPIGELKDLLQAVRNIDDADAPFLQLPDYAEERICFGDGEGGGGLVEDEEAGVEGEGFGNFDHLLLRGGQAAEGRGRIDMEFDAA